MKTWGNDPNPSKPTRNLAINSDWTLVTDKNLKVKANKKRDINETVINEQLINNTNRFTLLNKGSKSAIPVIVNVVSRTIPGKRVQKGKPKTTVIGDSFTRGMTGELAHNLGNTFEVIGHVMTGAGMKTITENG